MTEAESLELAGVKAAAYEQREDIIEDESGSYSADFTNFRVNYF